MVIIFALFTGCNKTYTVYCPKMPDAFNEWLPYQVNDSLLFENTSTAETKQSVIIKVTKSEAYEAKEKNRFMSNKVRCIGSTYIETTNRSFDVSFDADLARLLKNKPSNDIGGGVVVMNVVCGSFRFHMNKSDSTNNISIYNYRTGEPIIPIKNFSLHNQVYHDVIIFENDTLSMNDSISCDKKIVWKVVLSKNLGIIAYYNRGSNQEWIRQ
jgi:hypothetical protein